MQNVKTHLWLLYAAKPHLEKSEGGGSFVTVASLAGVLPTGEQSALQRGDTPNQRSRHDLRQDVRCNSVSPGLVMTEWYV
jgi:NAD(P)-dependent dehydrogenase (short-subunit alcohol dehydrogenase family)